MLSIKFTFIVYILSLYNEMHILLMYSECYDYIFKTWFTDYNAMVFYWYHYTFILIIKQRLSPSKLNDIIPGSWMINFIFVGWLPVVCSACMDNKAIKFQISVDTISWLCDPNIPWRKNILMKGHHQIRKTM